MISDLRKIPIEIIHERAATQERRPTMKFLNDKTRSEPNESSGLAPE